MTIANNTFCWQGLTTNVEGAPAFYASVLGWTMSTDGGAPVFLAPGGAVGHLQAPEGTPPHWCTFLAVDDLDGLTAEAGKEGAVLVPPTKLPAGRFSLVSTPSGAPFALYESAESDTMAKPGAGSVHWVELQSTAPEGDVAWLEKVFGFSHKSQTMAMGPYHVLEDEGVPRGGVMASQSGRSAFMAWVHVDDLEATLSKVDTAGGKRVTDTFSDPDVGQMAMVADPSGAVFGLVQPS